MQRIAGSIAIKVNGETHRAAGAFTYNLGVPKREVLTGHDGVHGYKELPKPAMIDGTLRDADTLDVAALLGAENATITLELGNGKTIAMTGAVQTNDGDQETENATINVTFSAAFAEEV